MWWPMNCVSSDKITDKWSPIKRKRRKSKNIVCWSKWPRKLPMSITQQRTNQQLRVQNICFSLIGCSCHIFAAIDRKLFNYAKRKLKRTWNLCEGKAFALFIIIDSIVWLLRYDDGEKRKFQTRFQIQILNIYSEQFMSILTIFFRFR